MGKIGLFLLVGLVKRWQIPLAIHSIVDRLNRYLSNNSLVVMVSKGILLSQALELLHYFLFYVSLSFLTPSWILSKFTQNTKFKNSLKLSTKCLLKQFCGAGASNCIHFMTACANSQLMSCLREQSIILTNRQTEINYQFYNIYRWMWWILFLHA